MKTKLIILTITIFAIQTTIAKNNDTIPNNRIGISFFYSGLLNVPKEKMTYLYWQGEIATSREYKNTFSSDFTFLININVLKKLSLNTGISLLHSKIEAEDKTIGIENSKEIFIEKEKYISIPFLISYQVINIKKLELSPIIGVYLNEIIYKYSKISNISRTIESSKYFNDFEAPFLNFEAGFNTDYKLNKNLALSLKLRYIAWDIYSFTKQPTHMDLSNIYTISIGVGIKYYL